MGLGTIFWVRGTKSTSNRWGGSRLQHLIGLTYMAEAYPVHCSGCCDRSCSFIQAMSSTKRLLVYTVPVTMISFALNIPKFFEVKLNEYNGTEVVNEEESRREPTFVFW